eukprot:NODE_59_length_25653_cov_0.289622.p10 type:complete len:347 gc:universal NODE_59_length_25653_cov_0.289622:23996-25036(+)
MLESFSTASKPIILAPMVSYGHLPFRLLARNYGADVAFSPMIHTRMYQQPKYRNNFKFDDGCVAQICGNNVEDVMKTCKLLEPAVKAIDLNLGCPQGIASKGNYGAFLMEQPDTVSDIVKALSTNLSIPISCKVRIFNNYEDTLKWCTMLQSSGARMITVHGRTRKQRGSNSGLADWHQIKKLKQALSVPVIMNGNILYSNDIEKALKYTGCDGLMIAETALYHPGIFNGTVKPVWEFAREYLDIYNKCDLECSMAIQKGHIFKFFRNFCKQDNDLSMRLTKSRDLLPIIEEWEDRIRERYDVIIDEARDIDFDFDDSGYRDIPAYLTQPYIRDKSHGIYSPKVDE